MGPGNANLLGVSLSHMTKITAKPIYGILTFIFSSRIKGPMQKWLGM